MRLRRLHLRNFRTFEHADIELGDLTLLIGPNDAGKSSILDAVRWLHSRFRNGLEPWDRTDVAHPPNHPDNDEDEIALDTGGIVSVTGDFDDLSEALADSYRAFLSDGVLTLGVAFDYTDLIGPCIVVPEGHAFATPSISAAAWRHEGHIWLDTEYMRARDPQASTSVVIAHAFADPKGDLLFGRWLEVVDLPGPGSELHDSKVLIRPFLRSRLMGVLGELPSAFVDVVDSAMAQATYDITNALVPLGTEYLSPASRIILAQGRPITLDRLADALIDESADMDIYLQFSSRPTPDQWDSSETTVPVGAAPLGVAGAGAQRAVALAIMELYANPDLWPNNKPTILLLEEPEAGLHPAAQRRVAQSLSRYREKYGLQAIVTTHSPVLINAQPDSVVLVSRDETATKRPSWVRPSTALREVAEIVGVSPSDVLLARHFVIVEGETERRVFPIWARTLGLDLDRVLVEIVPAGGYGPASMVNRLLGLIYPGATISVVLDDGDDTRVARDAIIRDSGDTITVDLLPFTEIEAAYTREAIAGWLLASGADHRVAERRVRQWRGAPTKRMLSGLAENLLGRKYSAPGDGEAIARRMSESDLAPSLKAILLAHLAS